MERLTMAQKLPKNKQQVIFRVNSFEADSWGKNRLICGIDEVGRGCLAGPLVTAAVILPINTVNPLLKDSKIMTEAERNRAYAWIVQNCRYGIGMVHHRVIDRHNVWHATLIAMKRALIQVLATAPELPEHIVVDAMPLNIQNTSYASIPVHHFYKGESNSISIAAASIVAKVTRDAMMKRYENVFPGYFMFSHKGYCTKKHTDALLEQPHSVVHRKTFLKNIPLYTVHKRPHDYQQSLC